MNMLGSLKGNAVLYLAGTGLYALCQWLLVIIYARSAGPEGVGLFALATAIGAPIIVLSQMSMRQVLIADVSERFGFSEYLLVRWSLTILAILCIAAVALAMGYRATNLLVIVAFGLGRAFESVSDIYYARSQANGGLHRVSCYTGARGLVTLSVSGGVMIATHDMLAAAVGFAVASLACQLAVRAIERRLLHEGQQEFWLPAIPWQLMIHAAPLAIAQFLGALAAYSPRLVLQHFGGERLAGQASAIEYFLAVGVLGVAALGQAASSPMARAYHHGDREGFLRLVTTLAVGSAVLAGGIALAAHLFAREAILRLYGASFVEAADAAAVIVTGGVIGYVASVLGYAVSATGRYQNLVTWSVAALAVTIVSGYVFVGSLGLDGLGYAFAVSGAMGICANIYLIRRACARIGEHLSSVSSGEEYPAHG